MRLGDRLALIVWLGILTASSWVIVFHTRFTTDLTAFLPALTNPAQKLLVDQLREGVASRLLLIGLVGDDAESLATSSRNLATALAKTNQFSYVNNGASALSQSDYAFIKQYRYLLSPNAASLDFSEDGLSSALSDAVMLMASTAGPLLERVLPHDPTLAVAAIVESWSAARQPETQFGVWFSAAGERALLLAETTTGGFDIERQQQALAVLQKTFLATRQSPSVQMQISGPSVFALKVRDVMHRDAVRLSVGALIAVTALLLLAYRSIWLIALSLLPVVSGMLVAIASVSLGFGFVHGITLGFGITLLGEAVDYPTYLFTRLARGTPAEKALSSIWPTLRLAALTTILGSMTMLLSSFTGIAQLGFLSMIGVGFAILVTRWILPQLTPKNFVLRERPKLTRALDNAGALMARFRWLVFLAAPLSIVYLAAHAESMWEDDLAALSPLSEADKQLDKSLRADLGAPDVRHVIVIREKTIEMALQKSERLAVLLDSLRVQGVIDGYDMAVRYLPSIAKQKLRYRQIPAADMLRENVVRAVEKSQFKAGFFEPFLNDISSLRSAQPLLGIAALQKTAAGVKVNALLRSNHSEATALIPLYAVHRPDAIQLAVRNLSDASIVALDLKEQSEQMLHQYRDEALRYTALGIIAIIAVLAVGLRSVRAVVRVVAPVAIAVLATSAILVATGQRLSLFHMVSLLLVLGIGLNYALFFNQRMTERSQDSTTFSIVVCAATTISSFAVLALSQTPILHAIGITVAGGTLASLLFAAALAQQAPRA